MPICSQYCFRSTSLVFSLNFGPDPKTWTSHSLTTHHIVGSQHLSSGPAYLRWYLHRVLPGLFISRGSFCALSLVPGAPRTWSSPEPQGILLISGQDLHSRLESDPLKECGMHREDLFTFYPTKAVQINILVTQPLE